jgi:hypothetical protein
MTKKPKNRSLTHSSRQTRNWLITKFRLKLSLWLSLQLILLAVLLILHHCEDLNPSMVRALLQLASEVLRNLTSLEFIVP